MLTAQQAGRIAAAAAYQAVVNCGLGHAANLAAVMAQAAAGLPAQTPMEVRAAIPGAPHADLAHTLTESPAACAAVSGGAGLAFLDPVGEIIARAHSQVAIDLTTVVNGVATWPAIGTRSSRATDRAFQRTRNAAASITPLAGTLGGHLVATTLRNAIAPAAQPTTADIGTAASNAAFEAARAAMGYSALHGESPATAAATVYARVNGLGLANISALVVTMLAAAAALSPYIPINPETPIAAALNGGQITRVCNLMKAAVAGAYAGVLMVGNHHPAIASVAAAAARAARGAAMGLPQPGCHRHPRMCGANTCTLTMHY